MRKDPTQRKLEEALEMAKRLSEQTQMPGKKEEVNDNDASPTDAKYVGPIDKGKFYAAPVNALARLYKNNEKTLANIFALAALPFTHILWPIARTYMKFFNWAARKPVPGTDRMRYTFNGVAAALGATLLMAAFLRFGVPAAYDTAIALTTDKTEELYIMGTEIIDDGETYAVYACKELPCTRENSVYFHIEQDWGYPHFELFPEELAGGIPNEVSYGEVTHNGVRIKLPIIRKYREIKDYKLTPLNELPATHPARKGMSNTQIESISPPTDMQLSQ